MDTQLRLIADLQSKFNITIKDFRYATGDLKEHYKAFFLFEYNYLIACSVVVRNGETFECSIEKYLAAAEQAFYEHKDDETCKKITIQDELPELFI